MPKLIDPIGRSIEYLRISVTDRCNYRCQYCMPKNGIAWLPHDKIITYEEIIKLVGIFEEVGIKKIRFTGGEPFIRNGFVDFIFNFISAFPKLIVSVTTNGSLLCKFSNKISRSGLASINVSLDTLSSDKFRKMTINGKLADVLAGIDFACEKISLVKINSVLFGDACREDVYPLIEYAKSKKILLRFIEFMPANKMIWSEKDYVSAEELLRLLNKQDRWIPQEKKKFICSGPATYYCNEKTGQMIGVISAVSNHFCASCNRLRLSSTGFLYPCLFSSFAIDVLTPLRRDDYSTVSERILQAVSLKPHKKDFYGDTGVALSRIGG